MKPLVLIVEDDPQIRRFVRAALAAEGYRLHECTTAEDGIAQAAERRPDLILLDLGLPDKDGLELIEHVRAWSGTPILVLSARGQEQDKIVALDKGADDYVAKPFAIGELLARVRAVLRRSSGSVSDGPLVRFGTVEIDREARRVRVDGADIHLTPNEYRLLMLMVQHAGKVLTHGQLLNEVWGPEHTEDAQYLRVYVAQLRRKLERDPARPKFLQTEPGVGYRLLIEP